MDERLGNRGRLASICCGYLDGTCNKLADIAYPPGRQAALFEESRPGKSNAATGAYVADTGLADRSHCSICSWPTTPACCMTRRPPAKTAKLGMPRTLKREATSG